MKRDGLQGILAQLLAGGSLCGYDSPVPIPPSPARRFFTAPHLLRRLLISALFACSVFYIWRALAEAGMGYEWQWNRAWRSLGQFGPDGFAPGPLLKGIAMTLAITAAGAALAAASGLLAAIMRLSPWPLCAALARAYVALWRSAPLLLQLFFAYFLISPLLDMSPFWTAACALGAFEGAYFCEICRAGILSVAREQWEASLSLGFGLMQTLVFVILPQAIRNMLPALANQAVALLKDTSLVSAIAVADLTMQSQAIVAETFLAFEVWLLAGAAYLVMAFCLSLPALWLERRRRWR